jgi:hypothetical protein
VTTGRDNPPSELTGRDALPPDPVDDKTVARLEMLRELGIRAIQFRNAQRRGSRTAERGLNAALEAWTRVHDRLLLADYVEREERS